MNAYPQLPLSEEFVAALKSLPQFATNEDVQKLRRKFHELRERIWPGYVARWEQDVEEWAKQA